MIQLMSTAFSISMVVLLVIVTILALMNLANAIERMINQVDKIYKHLGLDKEAK